MPKEPTDERDRDRLDRRLAEGRLKPRHLRAVARALAAVHTKAAAAPEHGGEPALLLRESRQALEQLFDRGAISAPESGALEYRMHRVLTHGLDALLDRHSEGRIRQIASRVDPAHIHVRGAHASIIAGGACTGADTAFGLASLSTAIRTAGDALAAERLLAAYALASDDYSLYGVIECFETLSACLRAAETEDDENARRELRPWLAETRRPLSPPALVVLVGGVATGKSTLAKALFAPLHSPRVVADRVRAATLDAIAERAGSDAALERAWSSAFDERLYTAMLQRARHVLASGRSCVIDSCSPRRSHRERAAALARELDARLVLCTCEATRSDVIERLDARDGRDGVTPGDWSSLAERLETRFEPVADDEAGLHLRISTQDTAAASATVARSLATPRGTRARSGPASGWPAGVTFDCWKTLLVERDWVQAHALRVDALLAAVHEDGAELDRAIVSDAFDAAWQRHMDRWRDGVHSGAREVARWSLEQLGLPLPESVVEHLTERFQTASHTGRVEGLDGARETLTALRSAGVAMALVCDTGLTPGRVVRRHLDRAGLLEPLDAVRFSDEVGVPKPDRRIFQSALDAIGARPEQSVHVGDLHRTDVTGARAIGMGTIRITAAHDDAGENAGRAREADAVVDSHAELLRILRDWEGR